MVLTQMVDVAFAAQLDLVESLHLRPHKDVYKRQVHTMTYATIVLARHVIDEIGLLLIGDGKTLSLIHI